MSTRAHILVVGGRPGLAARARRRIEDLERRWTRFADSELTALNARAGEMVRVSDDLYRLVSASVTAWQQTGGRFDPTILDSLVASGYDRSLSEIDDDDPRPPGEVAPAPGCGGISLWPDRHQVLLPPGVALDPGGIGKGLAADLVVDELLERGVDGALVNLGGDTRAAGTPPEGDEWVVSIEAPWAPEEEFARIAMASGAVASSSALRRRWRRGGEELHHLLDPATGRAVATDVVGATVVAGQGWWAEATTKSLLVAGSEAGLASLVEASAVVFLADGTWRSTPDLAGAVLR